MNINVCHHFGRIRGSVGRVLRVRDTQRDVCCEDSRYSVHFTRGIVVDVDCFLQNDIQSQTYFLSSWSHYLPSYRTTGGISVK